MRIDRGAIQGGDKNMINKTISKGSKFGYGIPDDLIKKEGSFWLPIGNVRFKKTIRKYKRRHNQVCPVCKEKKKNIRRHYQLYHPKFWYKNFIKPLGMGETGELYGVRFITSI